MKLFIGVDGGATKTHAIIENNEGIFLAEGYGGPANIRLSVPIAWQSVLDAVNSALQKINLNLNDSNHKFYIGLGLAGCEIPEAYSQFINTPHKFAALVLKTDGYTACLGAHAGKDGAIIVIGTGVVAFQIEGTEMIQIAGWGFPHDDIGSGAWMGVKAIGLTLQWLDGRIEKTSPLLEKIFDHFNRNQSEMVIWANKAQSTQFAEIAPFVLKEIANQDYYALEIIKESAMAIDLIGKTLVKRSVNHTHLPCSLLGGAAKYVEPWLDKNLRKRLVPGKFTPAKGAILALKMACIAG